MSTNRKLTNIVRKENIKNISKIGLILASKIGKVDVVTKQ